MMAWVIGVPLALTLMLLGLEHLEARLVAPIDRADKVRHLLATPVSPDELAATVAKLLEPSIRWSPHDEPSHGERRRTVPAAGWR